MDAAYVYHCLKNLIRKLRKELEEKISGLLTEEESIQFKNDMEEFLNQTEEFRDEAEQFKNLAEGYRDEAEGFKNDSEQFRNQAEGFRNESEGYRDESEQFRNEAEYFAYLTGLGSPLWYGVEWDVTIAAPELTRIGNLDMHRELPIQNTRFGCVLTDDGSINY